MILSCNSETMSVEKLWLYTDVVRVYISSTVLLQFLNPVVVLELIFRYTVMTQAAGVSTWNENNDNFVILFSLDIM